MSYQVIARKWRPKTFAELVGQSHVSQTLLNALRNNRLHHALLFTGPRGTGKTSSARILAKSLRCPNAVDFVPCHECRDCQDVANGRSIDVIEIDGASNNGVDAIRELRETVGYMPSSGKYKLYIIDEVHMLSTSAFNALLKTLEEPPEHVIFVMATTEAHKIPNTILSRCQRFDFRRIPVRDIAARLGEICQADGIKCDEEALWLVARQGDGSMRDSQSLLDQVITFSDGQVTRDKTIEVLGLTDRTLLLETVQALVDRNTQTVVDIIERVFTAGYDPKIFVQDLLEELRHLLLVKITNGQVGSIVDLPDSEVTHLHQLSESLTEEDIHLLFDMALKGGNDLLRSQDTRVVLEMILLRMSSAPRVAQLLSLNLGQAPSASAAPARPAAISRPTPTRSAEPAKKSPAQTAAEKPAAPQPEPEVVAPAPVMSATPTVSGDERWLELIKKIKRVNPMVSAKLEHSCLLGIEDKVIRLAVPDKMKFLSGQIEDKEFQKKLLNYVGTFWGPGYQVEVGSGGTEAEKKTPKAIEKQRQEDQVKSTREEVENHPFVQSAQKVFKSQIKAIKETT
ncbi:MAG: DNA polymerase III subunit gamma/tau [Bdellovibrionaceae bacterium]|nr:DNA polymerase III subunit gamma/tau [Bdellovibrionales bacterium]MCB9085261.1 DNA polymerase III subunit gamma/tau [Pseudobdellovibrionaceae bacterium]